MMNEEITVSVSAAPSVEIPLVIESKIPDPQYYTKAEMNELLDENYWTKQETAAAIANIQTMKIVVVEELPAVENAAEYTIYLVPAEDDDEGNVYDEYLVINHAWEKIGSTAVDLSQYAMLSGANTFIASNTFTGGISLTDGTTYGKFVQGYAVGNGRYNLTAQTGHAENLSIATGYCSHSEGENTSSNNRASHAEGIGTNTADDGQHVAGKWNISVSGARVTGGGTGIVNKKNIEVLDWQGNLTLAGDLTVNINGTPVSLSSLIARIEALEA